MKGLWRYRLLAYLHPPYLKERLILLHRRLTGRRYYHHLAFTQNEWIKEGSIDMCYDCLRKEIELGFVASDQVETVEQDVEGVLSHETMHGVIQEVKDSDGDDGIWYSDVFDDVDLKPLREGIQGFYPISYPHQDTDWWICLRAEIRRSAPRLREGPVREPPIWLD